MNGWNKCYLVSDVQLFATPCTVASQAPLSMYYPGKNTGVGSHSLLQGIFPTQGSNPGLLHCKQILNIWASREAEPFIAPSFSNFWEVFAFVFAQDMSSWVVFRECRSRISSFSVTWELQRKTNSWTLLEGLSIRNSVDGAQVSGF